MPCPAFSDRGCAGDRTTVDVPGFWQSLFLCPTFVFPSLKQSNVPVPGLGGVVECESFIQICLGYEDKDWVGLGSGGEQLSFELVRKSTEVIP